MKILIVEDDKRISAPIIEDLSNQHHIVELAENGVDALLMSEHSDYDLVLLDVMLPQIDGIEVCRRLRARGFKGGVLMLTARQAKDDKITGLDSGADDYLIKPFDIDELNARLRALLRRSKDGDRTDLVCGLLTVDLRRCVASYGGSEIALTPTEYRLLTNFMRSPTRIFTKNELIEKLWNSAEAPSDAVIKAHIMGLRQKLEAAGAPKNLVETVYGFGYRLNSYA